MSHTIDLHDTVSVMIPGACALSVLLFFVSGGQAEFSLNLKNLSTGSSLVFLAVSYVVGELLQLMGKSFAQHLIYSRSEGAPYYWLLDTKKTAGFLPIKNRERILESLKGEFSWKRTGKSTKRDQKRLYSFFHHIKIKVYADDAYRAECIKMLTKQHFFCSVMMICILTPIIYIVLAAFNACCSIGATSSDSGTEVPETCSSYCLSEFFIVFFICAACGYACCHAYRSFDRAYCMCLYTSYLAVLKKENAQANTP